MLTDPPIAEALSRAYVHAITLRELRSNRWTCRTQQNSSAFLSRDRPSYSALDFLHEGATST